jgi:hypothetical protein
MLNEAILKFKGLAPLILPELVNNNQLEEVSMYEDYAILPYSVQKPLPLEEVMDMFDDFCDEWRPGTEFSGSITDS